MFICKLCLEEDYTNDTSLFQSYGRCEACRKTTTCSDIPSKHLELNDKAKADIFTNHWRAWYDDLTDKELDMLWQLRIDVHSENSHAVLKAYRLGCGR